MQGYFDDFTTPFVRMFRFVAHLPLVSVSLRENEPFIENVSGIKCDGRCTSLVLVPIEGRDVF